MANRLLNVSVVRLAILTDLVQLLLSTCVVKLHFCKHCDPWKMPHMKHDNNTTESPMKQELPLGGETQYVRWWFN